MIEKYFDDEQRMVATLETGLEHLQHLLGLYPNDKLLTQSVKGVEQVLEATRKEPAEMLICQKNALTDSYVLENFCHILENMIRTNARCAFPEEYLTDSTKYADAFKTKLQRTWNDHINYYATEEIPDRSVSQLIHDLIQEDLDFLINHAKRYEVLQSNQPAGALPASAIEEGALKSVRPGLSRGAVAVSATVIALSFAAGLYYYFRDENSQK